MTNSDFRIFRLEGLVRRLQEELAGLQDAVTKLKQEQYQPIGGTQGGGGGAAPLYATPSVSIPASLASSITGQTVNQVASGAFAVINSTATIWNPLPAATAASKMLVVGQNNDGSFSVEGEVC
jgi:hypothetical protein